MTVRHIVAQLEGLSVAGKETPAFYRAEARKTLNKFDIADPNFRHFLLEILRGCVDEMGSETRKGVCDILRSHGRPVFVRNKIKAAKRDHRFYQYD